MALGSSSQIVLQRDDLRGSLPGSAGRAHHEGALDQLGSHSVVCESGLGPGLRLLSRYLLVISVSLLLITFVVIPIMARTSRTVLKECVALLSVCVCFLIPSRSVSLIYYQDCHKEQAFSSLSCYYYHSLFNSIQRSTIPRCFLLLSPSL